MLKKLLASQIGLPHESVTRFRTDLNGAKFSNPASEMDDTNAMGLGMMPLFIMLYTRLSPVREKGQKQNLTSRR